MTIDALISEIIKREGGYVDNPADRGGPTKYGITMPTLAHWRQKDVTAADIKALDESEARAIYYVRFVVAPGFMALTNDNLRGVVVDIGVISGPVRAIKRLQEALKVKADGVLGPVTLAAANSRDGTRLAVRTLTKQIDYIADITAGNLDDKDGDGIPDNLEMLRGWTRRYTDQIRDLVG